MVYVDSDLFCSSVKAEVIHSIEWNFYPRGQIGRLLKYYHCYLIQSAPLNNEPHQDHFQFFNTSHGSKHTFFKLFILNYDYMNILGL